MAGTVSILDATDGQLLAKARVGGAPCAVQISRRLGCAFVANCLHDTVSRIDLGDGRLTGTFPVGRGPVGLALSADEALVYVGNRGEGTVSVLDARDGRELRRLLVGEAPAGCVEDPRTGWLLVSNAGSSTLTVVDPRASGGAADVTSPLLGKRLPAFSLPELDAGHTRTSLEWAERLYILNFFASW
jgi:DNA-binding beta-propeller fold protein YncE